MSGKVHQFLNESGGNNFTEMAPRPPVPGEENEIQSNGGISTKSSGSLKSHISGKSHSSSKSAVSQRSDTNYSPAATPRRSSRDKSKLVHSQGTNVCTTDHNDDDEAPMGFEPEGSASNSPPFHENDTPPYLRWARSFKYLMEDGDGVELFKRFLDDEGCDSNSLNFWFACQGLKAQASDPNKVSHIIKAINKIYIKCDRNLKISDTTRRDIADKLGNKLSSKESDIFNTAQEEVESYMRENAYQSFLKSDIYLEYVQCQGKSPKSSEASSGSNSVRPTSGPLPTLLEDRELANESLDHSTSFNNSTSGKLVTSFTHPADVLVPSSRSQRKTEAVSTSVSCRSNVFYPVHQTYAPVSAQDSEIQSLSSDAPTDDTMSLTDGSVDAIPTNPKAWKQLRRSVQRKAQRNHEAQDSSMHQVIIPRTDRGPKDRNIAETDPKKFATLLVDRLERLQQELSREEKMKESLRKCESEVEEERTTSGSKPSAAATLITLINHPSFTEEFNADSILEEHCSRVWSTGQHSPLSRSPDRTRGGKNTANTTFPGLHATAAVKPHHRNAKRDRDMMSQSCIDNTTDTPTDSHQKHHTHHHSHHSSSRKRYDLSSSADTSQRFYPDTMSKSYIDPAISGPGMTEYITDSGRVTDSSGRCTDGSSRGRSAYRKMNPRSKATSDSSGGGVDSGVSVSGDTTSATKPPMPNPSDPNYSKVMQWIMASENVPTGTTTNTDSDKTSTSTNQRQRSAGKLVNVSSSQQQPFKQTSSSRVAPLPNQRASSTDRSPWLPSGIVPGQPFLQDPCMPLLNPPNTVTQLEEAKRRLENEARVTQSPPKSKSFSGLAQTKDRGGVGSASISQTTLPPSGLAHPTPSVPHSSVMPSSDLNMSGDGRDTSLNMSLHHNTSMDRKPTRRSISTVAPTQPVFPNTSRETVIGYYFCGDPIPFRHVVKCVPVTLATFKKVTGKRGYRYYFKKASDEFGSGAIFEEISDESELLPLFEGKIHARVERYE